MVKQEFTLKEAYHFNRSGPLPWIISHLLRYFWFPLIIIVTAVMNNYFYGRIQIFVGQAFDIVTAPDWKTAALFAVVASAVGAAIAQGLLGLTRDFSTAFLAERIERDARDELYASLLGKSQTFHSRQRIGDIMARATNDVRMLNSMFSPGIMLIVDSAMALAIPFFLIAGLDTRLLLAPAVFLALWAVTVWDYNRRLSPVSKQRREQFGTMNAGLAESIAGIEVVKANVQEHYEWDKFTHNASRFRDYFVKQGDIQAFYLPQLAFTLCRAGGFLHAMLLWRGDSITLGQVIAFMGLMGTLRFPTFISIFTFNLVSLGMASARRILELINTESELDENQAGIAQPIEGAVAFRDVRFGYGERCVLQDISFRAAPGETIAIVGQTGSGKTTLTRLINRIFDADAGQVLVDGIDVREWSLESLRSQVSAIEQDVFLFSRTLRENIAFGVEDATEAEIVEAAKAAQAHEFIMGFADGYDTEVGERGVTLSGGQRQRIAIARAFLTQPKILILDDSTSAVDSATEDKIQRAMRRISDERTTFIITHRLSQIRWADRILVLRQGRLVDQGTHEELLERSTAYRRIFERYD